MQRGREEEKKVEKRLSIVSSMILLKFTKVHNVNVLREKSEK